MNSEILSVGIDIGTSTTQVIFSKLRMENTSNFFSVPRISIVEKEVVYKSRIYITPLKTASLIDGDAVRNIVETEFKESGFMPKDTATGAVIITGESARKENAALVLEKLSSFAGDFVVSTAGPDIESEIAGKGSGAQQYSQENDCVTVNLDIGGGTTNIAAFDCGEVIAKGCFDIGGRQVRIDNDFKVEYISPSAEIITKALNLKIKAGEKTDINSLRSLCDEMANLLGQALNISERTPLLERVKTSGSSDLNIDKPVRAVFFSGGVADCIYKTGFDILQFGDLGVLLGNSIRNSRLTSAFRLVIPKETIRATVVGAGTYTTSVSGSTITYTNDIFPLKNIPVFKLSPSEEQRCFDGDSVFLLEKVKWFLKQNDTSRFVLALKGRSNPSYGQLRLLASCIGSALEGALEKDEPFLILVERDIAKALGQLLSRASGSERCIISVDGIKVGQNNFIDFGKPLMDGLVIPVVVKTLIFG